MSQNRKWSESDTDILLLTVCVSQPPVKLIKQLINLRKVRTENLKFRQIFEIESWMVGQ